MFHSTYISKLDKKFDRIFDLEPNDLQFPLLTYVYKLLTRPLKSIPIVYIVPLSLVGAIFLYLVFGPLVVKLVSLLQYGF